MSNSTAAAPAILAIGDVVETMLVGKIVKVRVQEITHTTSGIEYGVAYLGGRICLDFGENWYIHDGYQFTTRPVNIARAAEWRAKGF